MISYVDFWTAERVLLKITANHLAQGVQRIPTIHSQSTHKLSTDDSLAKPLRPHYLVS